MESKLLIIGVIIFVIARIMRRWHGKIEKPILRKIYNEAYEWIETGWSAILLAAFIAWPVAWYLINKWLQGYAFRIDMPYWMFLLEAIIALLLALSTVSYHSWRVSSRNPADSLRYE